MKHQTYQRNHAIVPGREKALHDFLNQTYKGKRHKLKNGFSSNSEDALTWSCFDAIEHLPPAAKLSVLDEIMEDALQGECTFKFSDNSHKNGEVTIFVGKQYTGQKTKESTEVDASIESPDKLIFIEAKLYSSISSADPEKCKPHDQIAKKLRVGLDSSPDKEFYFIFLDIAPNEKLAKRERKDIVLSPGKGGFYDKWKSAWVFNYYKHGHNNSLKPLRECLRGIDVESFEAVAKNMGWLTWSDLYKNILRGIFMASTSDAPGKIGGLGIGAAQRDL